MGGLRGQETSKSIVPSNGSSNNTKGTAGLLGGQAVVELASSEEDKGDEQEEEEGDETAGGPVRGDEHDTSEDGPPEQVDGDSVVNLSEITDTSSVLGGIGVNDAEPRNEDHTKGEPEGTIRAEGSGTKGIASLELPHTSEQLLKEQIKENIR